MLEKRRHARTSIELPVTFTVTGSSEQAHGIAKDISIGGVFIETSTAAAFGAEIVVRAELRSATHSFGAFDLPGVVRWVRAGGMGVQFRLLGVHETHAITEMSKSLER